MDASSFLRRFCVWRLPGGREEAAFRTMSSGAAERVFTRCTATGRRLQTGVAVFVLATAGLCAAGAVSLRAQDGPQAIYRARLSARDHFNSSGERLKNAAEIIRQDRANFHRYRKRDKEDTGDPIFSDAAARASLDDARVEFRSASDVAAVLNGTPLVRVEIWGDTVRVSLH